jgi:serine/threonine-protein kinase
MPAKVTFTVKKGGLSGKQFTYDSKETLIIGRQDDCAVVLPEATVSRYHCLIDIAPPSVVIRDFGSLNGTFLNGEKIGQREAGTSVEEARQSRGEEFPMAANDRLGVGPDCELELDVSLPLLCADCGAETESQTYLNDGGLPICGACHEKLTKQKEERRKAKEAANKNEAKRKMEQKQRHEQRCEICGQVLIGAIVPCICPACQANPLKVLDFLLAKAQKGQDEAKEIAGYRNLKMLGQGGMGQVWLVEEEKTGNKMALKIMLPKVATDEKSREAFTREALITGRLSHKNIIRQHKFGESGGTYFILMELCDGGSVDALMGKSGGKLDIETATRVILQVLDGLAYAHSEPMSVQLKNGKTASVNGVVHRDFKPANIFLASSGKNTVAKVADFGLAKAFEASGMSGHTHTGQVAGTPVFMPRQQIINFKYSKPDVDVWAAAASYYNMLTGAYPKDFGQGKDVFLTALNTSAVPVRKRNPAIPKKLAEVIDRALTEKPEIGVKSAAELKKLIERVF